jgi:hypothetical protein
MIVERIEVEEEFPANDDGTWLAYVYGFADSMGRKVCGEVTCRRSFTGRLIVEDVKVLDEDGREVESELELRDAIAAEAVK